MRVQSISQLVVRKAAELQQDGAVGCGLTICGASKQEKASKECETLHGIQSKLQRGTV